MTASVCCVCLCVYDSAFAMGGGKQSASRHIPWGQWPRGANKGRGERGQAPPALCAVSRNRRTAWAIRCAATPGELHHEGGSCGDTRPQSVDARSHFSTRLGKSEPTNTLANKLPKRLSLCPSNLSHNNSVYYTAPLRWVTSFPLPDG